MGIVSMREVKDHGPLIKLTIILSLIMVFIAVSVYFLIPSFKVYAEKQRLKRDLEYIENVYTVMQDIISEGSIENAPSALWDVTLSDFDDLSSLSELNKVMCEKLNVKSLKELEGDSFKSRAFKGSRYVIYMYDGSREIHLTVQSKDPEEHGDIVY